MGIPWFSTFFSTEHIAHCFRPGVEFKGSRCELWKRPILASKRLGRNAVRSRVEGCSPGNETKVSRWGEWQ